MNAAQSIASLDRQLAAHGQDITLRRVGSPNVDATVRAFVREYKARELTEEVVQGDTEVVVSPTSVLAASWPGALAQSDGTDIRVPRKGDKVIIAGRLRTVQAPAPVYIGATLVRINLQVRG